MKPLFFFFFRDIPQQFAASVCKPQGGVVSSPSLHPAGQSSQNRSLERRGNETPGCKMDTFASRGQRKRGEKRQPLNKSPPLMKTLIVGSSKANQDTYCKASNCIVTGDSNLTYVKYISVLMVTKNVLQLGIIKQNDRD